MYQRIIVAALVAFCWLPFIASAQASQADYESVHEAAVAAHEKAVAHGNQWTTTNDTLEAAEQAAAEGEYEQAVELARKARELAQQAVRQAEKQDEVWKQAVIR